MRLTERILLSLSRKPDSGDFASDKLASSLEGVLDPLSDAFPNFLGMIANRAVLDFGCGYGYQAVGMAQRGARRVVGVDTNQAGLANGRKIAAEVGVAERVSFTERLNPEERGQFDLVVSLNSMEHFPDPKAILQLMADALKPGGQLVITFSPPWYSPYGSHMHFFTRVPWVNLLFSERTVMAVRKHFRDDGATRYEDVVGGLNRMTLKKFNALVKQSGLQVRLLRYDPVKGLKVLTRLPLIRELFTNRVSCILEKPTGSPTCQQGNLQQPLLARRA